MNGRQEHTQTKLKDSMQDANHRLSCFILGTITVHTRRFGITAAMVGFQFCIILAT